MRSTDHLLASWCRVQQPVRGQPVYRVIYGSVSALLRLVTDLARIDIATSTKFDGFATHLYTYAMHEHEYIQTNEYYRMFVEISASRICPHLQIVCLFSFFPFLRLFFSHNDTLLEFSHLQNEL